jgi:HEAT repeat protein
VQVRAALLRAFGDSKQKVAVRKLMTIARNDQSVELRKAAVRYLGESKDPEALKFLEDLLK